MLRTNSRRIVIWAVTIMMLAALPTASLQAAPASAPTQQDSVLEAKTVEGFLPGGEFAKIWLGLDPDMPEAAIRVYVRWDRPNAANNGVGFFVLDEVGLNRAIAGSSLQDIATSGGNPVFEGADNEMDAKFTSFGLTRYTVVVFNDSDTGANFTAQVENGTFIDDSGQVTDPTAPIVEEGDSEEGAEGEEGVEGEATTDGEVAAEAPAEDAAPVAEGEGDATADAETTTEEVVAEATEEAETVADESTEEAEPVAEDTTAAPAQSGIVRAGELEGELTASETHYIGLIPREKDGQIELNLTFDPRDDTDLARRINFFVLRAEDLAALGGNTRPSDLAVAAGNRVFGGESNLRRANIQATGTGEYTILIINSSPEKVAQYQLTASNGTLVDDAGQTKTAQAAGTDSTATEADDSEETADDDSAATEDVATTDTAATPAPAAATTTQTTPRTPSAVVVGTGDFAPGSTYTVTSGDTLGIIAEGAFGDVLYYHQICAFNSIENCNVLEVGDVVRIPTLEEFEALGDNPTAVPSSAQPTATPAPATSTADEEADAEEEPAEEAADAADETTDATDDADAEDADAADAADDSAASGDDLLETAISTEDFNVLVAAVEAAGLEDALKGPGPLTVFAPTDAAFASLPAGVLDALLQDPGGQLTDVLLYHVVPGRLTASDIADGDSLQTVQGSEMAFNETSSGFNINNDANIIITDIEASNGIIHVIDGVIQPTGSGGSAAAASVEATAEPEEEPAEASASDVDLQSVIENLPVLDDAFSLTSEEEGEAISVSYKTAIDIEEAAEFYQDEMERNEFETTRSVIASSASTLKFEKDNVSVQVGITEDGDNNLITLTVEGN